jgi:hypothetical protein
VLTKLIQPVLGFLRMRVILVDIYLVAFWVTAPPSAMVRDVVRHTVQVSLHMGFLLSLSTSGLSLTQDITYIGGQFRTDLVVIFLLPASIEDLQTCARTFLRVGHYSWPTTS